MDGTNVKIAKQLNRWSTATFRQASPRKCTNTSSPVGLRKRWGGEPGFRVVKISGAWKHGEIPGCFEPVEFGAFFVSFVKA